MAELRIQPKKPAPSPWLLVGIAVLLLAAVAYFYLRPDPADEAAPASVTGPAPVAADSLRPTAPDTSATRSPIADSASRPAPTATSAETRTALLDLSPKLLELTDRADLRDDATIREQRDNFTSATARLADGDAQASLRPGLVAAASLLLAVQQKGYPNLETEATTLLRQANQLSGRDATAAEQAANRTYLSQLASLLNTLSYPPADIL